VAAFEDKETPTELYVKWGGAVHVTEIGHSPLDVVAWHGNYAPYKYDLRHFLAGRRRSCSTTPTRRSSRC
jgi:homogentisate 1,2-dioxygenase